MTPSSQRLTPPVAGLLRACLDKNDRSPFGPKNREREHAFAPREAAEEHFWMILTTNKLIRAEARLVEPGRGNGCTATIMNSLGSNPPLHIRIPSARAALEPSSFWPSISQLR